MTENIENLNSEIRQLLVETVASLAPDFHLEIAFLIQQIHRINHLIYQEENHWYFKLLKPKNNQSELITYLEEIKNILLIIKTGNLSLDSFQQWRLNLQKNLNNYQYLFCGYFLNFLLYIYYLKSTPFKILIGLLITTLISLVTLHTSFRQLSFVNDSLLNTQVNSQIPNTSLSENTPKITLEQQEKIQEYHDRNKHLLHSLMYAASAGVLGSVTSILLRIIQFQDKKYEDPLIPFFLGMFKPFIGLILGIFLFSLINSDTIIKIDFLLAQDDCQPANVTIDNNYQRNFFMFTCAFLIGFSERFATDLLKNAEASMNGQDDS